MPSFELLPKNLLSAMGSLEAYLGAAKVLAGAGTLAGREALKAADRESPMVGTYTKVRAGVVDRFSIVGAIA